KHRARTRKQRQESNVFQIGLIGYTNAGKSTLLNKLTNAETYEENNLFATLDPLTRQLKLPSGLNVTMTDAVGFIQDLPTQLIQAFHSTLEETRGVDLLLHVVDASAENMVEHGRTVMNLLIDLEMDHLPLLTIYNKSDLITEPFYPDYFPNIVMSARNEADIHLLLDQLMEKIEEIMEPYRIEVPVNEGDTLIQLKQETQIATQVYDEEKNVYVV